MVRKSFLLLSLLFISKISSQVNGEVFVLDEDRDVFYMHYTPSIQKDDQFSYQKANIRLGLPPIKVSNITLYNTVGLDYHNFKYDTSPPELTKKIEQFYNINYSLLIQYKISENWSINALAMPHVLSNLDGNIKADDFKFNGILFLQKKFNQKKANKYYKLTVGVGYLSLAGKTTINPTINLMGKVNDKLSFAIGIPNTYVKYNLNNRHSLKLLGDLNDFSAHINTPIYLNNDNIEASNAVFTSISAGLEYNYWLTNNFGLMIRGLHSVYENYELQDANENTIYDFNSKSKPYVTFGIKFNPFR
ncbi:DUF6268 family outer membrane beta-barrel protein [Aquimarina sediminis]|uniref:DUF6268 family outer membrane beta-barrel protein n=1 Tax=Aquimarina sediminis TaxID=2070536 RepID=UPI000CA0055E|nr:DUF6268 family outer membrane beta-barrel protein [Aquimarina sediminis]